MSTTLTPARSRGRAAPPEIAIYRSSRPNGGRPPSLDLDAARSLVAQASVALGAFRRLNGQTMCPFREPPNVTKLLAELAELYDLIDAAA